MCQANHFFIIRLIRAFLDLKWYKHSCKSIQRFKILCPQHETGWLFVKKVKFRLFSNLFFKILVLHPCLPKYQSSSTLIMRFLETLVSIIVSLHVLVTCFSFKDFHFQLLHSGNSTRNLMVHAIIRCVR